jgi:hypothetical protein
MKHLINWDKHTGNTTGRKGRYCLLTGNPGADVHHIRGRGFDGCDDPDNLMTLRPDAHEYFGQKKKYMNFLLEVKARYEQTGEYLYQYRPEDPVLIEFLKKSRTNLYFY